MAVVASGGSIVSTHQQALRGSISRGSSLTLYSGHVQDYAELYRVQPNLRLVIRFLARNIAQLGLKAYRRISDEERRPLEGDHELARFLKSPTPSLPKPVSPHVWKRGIVEDLALYDLLYVLKLRTDGPSSKLNGVRIPPPHMTPTGDSFLWPEGFRLKGNRGHRDYAAEDVIYLHGHNPADPRDGLSSVESLRRILAEEAAAGEYREQLWKNGARVSGVITRPTEAPKWSDTARNRFESDWRASRTGTGPEAGGTPILEDGMTFTEASFSAKESEYLGARRLTREETAAAFFIPPVFVGILEYANFSNIKEQHVSLYADTLGPWLDWITEELELQLLPDFDDVDDVYLEFNIEEKLRGRFEEQAAAMQTATGAPWLTRNEARSIRNLKPVEGGDELVVPLNVLVGGQASPTDSAPPPGPTTGEAARTPSSRKERNGEIPSYLVGWRARHSEVLSSFFERQGSAVLSKLGAGHELETAFDSERWNRELAEDLLRLSSSMADELGAEVAETFGAEFDLDRALPWLTVEAESSADAINAATFDALAETWSGVPRRGENRKALDDELDELGIPLEADDLEDPLGGESFLDPARELFAAAAVSRVPVIALTRATSLGQWSRREAADQSGARSKVWVASGASNSRHSALDGETVPLGESFSNGGQYPGDPALGVDETAGCLCSLDFTTT